MNLQLPNCCLCQTRQANQTNSHVFSWFLIRDAVNKPGIKGRENEVVFSLDGEFVRSYIGRGQSAEEKVIPIKGRPLNEQEIEQTENQNPFTRDNFLCNICEARLNVLETTVNEIVISNLRRQRVPANSAVRTVNLPEGNLLRLFIYSLCWRAAVVNMNTFEMQAAHEESLRSILNDTLADNRDALNQNITQNSQRINAIAVIVNFLEVTDVNNNPINCSISYKPYSIQLNDLGFQLYFDDAPEGNEDPLFTEINDVITASNFRSIGVDDLNVALISDPTRMEINQRLYTRMGQETIRKATMKFMKGFIYMFGLQPGTYEIGLFQKKLVDKAGTKVEGYTDDDQFTAAQETVVELFPWLFKDPE